MYRLLSNGKNVNKIGFDNKKVSKRFRMPAKKQNNFGLILPIDDASAPNAKLHRGLFKLFPKYQFVDDRVLFFGCRILSFVCDIIEY